LRAGEAAHLIEPVEGEPLPEQRQQRERWLSECSREGPLGKAALVEALATGELDAWIMKDLYRPTSRPDAFFPGPIAKEIAKLQAAVSNLRIMTLNYDDLIEQAFRDRASAPKPQAIATDNHGVPSGRCAVFHLHGYLGRDDRPPGELILSEADYMRMQQTSSWQEELVHAALRDSTLLFLGTSLLDPNVIRYLYGVPPPAEGPQRRLAVFVRQGAYAEEVPTNFREAREHALGIRWQALGVTAVFVDHYTDVAQVVAEITRRRTLGAEDYVPLPERARTWVSTVKAEILGSEDDDRFHASQTGVNALLVNALARAVDEAKKLEPSATWSETLQLALWLVDETGATMTNWVMTDRLHLDRATIEPVAIDEYARWVAVRAYCQGTSLAESRDIYASRWRFIRGTPLVLDTPRHGRIPIGCLTAASLSPREDSQLNAMRDTVLASFNKALSETVLTLLDQPFSS
jgi:hypothetical protein